MVRADFSDQPPIIAVRNFSAGYDGHVLLRDLSFDIYPGEVFVILGGSGSGKSTLLKHMIGLYRPAAGRIWIDGEDIAQAEGEARRRVLRRMGVMYQSGALFGSMTLLENVRLPLEEWSELPPDAMDAIAASKLKLVQLEGYERFFPAEISGGMKKRAAIARAMALEPTILFLDEPSAGLDPISARRLDDLILELRDSLGCTVVVVTHELASIFAIGDDAVVLDARAHTMIARGAPRTLLAESTDPKVQAFLTRGRLETR
jgi:phospholipid/cholesterol/gamma-HCH transport system ATP-binding protein